MNRIKLYVDQLECTSCSTNLDNFFKKQKGVANWEVNVFDKTVELDYDPTLYSEKDVIKLVKKSGFDAELSE